MTDFECDWIDAFTDQAFGGNGCAVVYDKNGLPDEMCCAFVKETSLTECTFVGPSDVADFKVRYFLAGGEIPFAGHPTLATAISLINRDQIHASQITFETRTGIVPIEIDESFGLPRITMTQRAPDFGPDLDPELLARIGGITANDIIAPPQVVSTGLPFCIVLLRDHDALKRVKLHPELTKKFQEAGIYEGLMEPYWATLLGATEVGDTFSRLPMLAPNPPEDAFTGSATGCLAAYLWSRGLIDDRNFIAEQGHFMGRPGQAQVQILGPQRGIQGIRVAGHGHVLMSGKLHLQ